MNSRIFKMARRHPAIRAAIFITAVDAAVIAALFFAGQVS